MAYIKKKSERKFKITVCNGYKVNGQKRMKAQTITVPSSVPKRGIQQYVMAEAERIEKKFKYGVEESDQTHFDRYAEAWLKRQEPYFKATTLAGYKRNLEIAYLQRRAGLSTAARYAPFILTVDWLGWLCYDNIVISSALIAKGTNQTDYVWFLHLRYRDLAYSQPDNPIKIPWIDMQISH